MGGFLVIAAFAAFAVALLALAKGSLPALRLANRKSAGILFIASLFLLGVGGSLLPPVETTGTDESPSPTRPASPTPDDDEFTIEVPTKPPTPARPPGVPAEAQEATVTRHIDGDTLWLEGGTLPPEAASTVRLLEMDTPEVGTPYAAEATDFLKQELPIGATVYLLADRGDTDRFGRYLRYLWDAEGEFSNEKAVRLGFARAVLIAPNDKYITQIRAAEAEARAARRGVWAAAAPAPPPPAPRAPAPAPGPPAPAPAPRPPAPAPAPAPGGAFANCTAARNAGAAPVLRGEPGYGSHLDRDDDGIGCE